MVVGGVKGGKGKIGQQAIGGWSLFNTYHPTIFFCIFSLAFVAGGNVMRWSSYNFF